MLYLGMLSKRSVGDLQSTKQLVMLYVLDNGPYQKVQIIFLPGMHDTLHSDLSE